jgi:hypothetical protein
MFYGRDEMRVAKENNEEKLLTFDLGLVLGDAEVRKKEMDVVLIPS